MNTKAQQCADAAAAFSSSSSPQKVVVGFDGFVDQIIDLVDKRDSPRNYRAIATIDQFGRRVSAAAGHSTNFEAIVKQRKLGGNGPIMASALANLSYDVTAIGVLGEGTIDPVFAPLVRDAKQTITLGAPANTDALEFSDGKVMMCKMLPLRAVTFDNIMAKVGRERLQTFLREADGIATVNWTMVVGMTEIWERLAKEIMPGLRATRPLWFIDLADPASRTTEDLLAALKALQALQRHVDIVLGMNGMECRQVLKALGAAWPEQKDELAAAQWGCETVRTKLGLAYAVCHLVKSAAVAWNMGGKSGTASAEGFFCANPAITTGAGDHFNAGFFAAMLARLEPVHCLHIGAATSSNYVRTGNTPRRADVVAFLNLQQQHESCHE